MNTTINADVLKSELFKKTIWPGYIQKFKTERTIQNYGYIVDAFIRYNGKSFELANEDDAKSYEAYLSRLTKLDSTDKQHINITTYSSNLSVLRSLSDFILKCNFIENYKNIFQNIKNPVIDTEIRWKDMPLIEDLEVLFEAAKESTRDFLIFSLAAKCALSTSQITKLRTDDIVHDKDGRITGLCIKSGKFSSFNIALPEDVKKTVERYMSSINHAGPLFLNSQDRGLNSKALQRLLKSYLDRNDVSDRLHRKDFTLQEMRHAAIKYMKIGEVDEADIAKYIGMANANNLARYRTVTDEEMEQAAKYSVLSVNVDEW